jgi:hypothetical protein
MEKICSWKKTNTKIMAIADALRMFIFNIIFWARVLVRAVWCAITLIVYVTTYFGLILPAVPLKWIW